MGPRIPKLVEIFAAALIWAAVAYGLMEKARPQPARIPACPTLALR
jgi:hypothetical protein